MNIRNLVDYLKTFNEAVARKDERASSIKVGAIVADLSLADELARAQHAGKVLAANTYMTRRGCHALTSPNFHYVPSVSTDVRVTMRKYVEETMPDAKETYKFLFQ